jgi:flagellar hook-associated protein 2
VSSLSFDGIVSGLNTSQIIEKLLSVERQPLVRLQQRKTDLQATLDLIRSINTSLLNLQTAVSKLTSRSSIGAKQASASSSAVAATASSDALTGSFRVVVSRLASPTRVSSSGPAGMAVDASVPLASAGFAVAPTYGSFTLSVYNPTTGAFNSAVIAVDSNTVLSNGTDAPGDNTILAKINAAGLGITASLSSDAYGRQNLLRLEGPAGYTIQVGAGGDTSNFLQVAKLYDAAPKGLSAATVTGSPVSAGALPSTTITINGVSTVTTATSASNTAYDNAVSIANDINNTPGSTVVATANADGTITLTQKTAGAAYTIDITNAGSGTGLSTGVTANGKDYLESMGMLGTALVNQPLTSARLNTPITGLNPDGTGSFTINGVTINYRSSDSLASVLARINTSGAGVTAVYDPILDKVRITSNRTGSALISMADSVGNFLGAIGLLGASQQPGQTAEFAVDTGSGFQTVTSSSNTVTGIIPGVTLQLNSVTADPVTVTVSQDTASVVSLVKGFIDQFNSLMSLIDKNSGYDPNTKAAGRLLGDSTVAVLRSRIRSIVSDAVLGAAGPYRSLADVGITTGRIGSAPGSANNLVLDEAKLTRALQDNPGAVMELFAGFSSHVSLSGSGSLVSASGSPLGVRQSGRYTITVDGAGNITAYFTPTGGSPRTPVSGTIAPGGTNNTLIPGVTLTADATLTNSTQYLDVTVDSMGAFVRLADYLGQVLASNGLMASRIDGFTRELKDLDNRMKVVQDRIDARETLLRQQFTRLESILAQYQAQSTQLMLQLSKLTGANG